MIKAVIVKDSDGIYKGFQISGHAGFDESGKDIICAAVSCLALNTVRSIDALTTDKAVSELDNNGILKLKLVNGAGRESKLLMDALVLGLTGIQEEYGSQYLKIRFEEV